MTLQGKHIVVLGGTSGIGLAVAEAVMEEGAVITIVSSQQSRVDAALRHLGPSAKGYTVQLSNEEEVERLFSNAGEFDHLVYTAGDTVLQRPIQDIQLEEGKRFFDVRFWGAFLAVKYGQRKIRAGGSIVLTSSTVPRRPAIGFSVGAGVSAAIEAFAKAMAVELAPIRVNCVAPGIVRTPIWDRLPQEQREAFFQARGATFPVGRVGEPKDIAGAYLSCMRGAYTTGQVLVVDGGMLLV